MRRTQHAQFISINGQGSFNSHNFVHFGDSLFKFSVDVKQSSSEILCENSRHILILVGRKNAL